MNKIKDIHTVVVIIFLMLIRTKEEGKWFGVVVLSILLIPLFEIIKKIYLNNLNLVEKKQKVRYGIFLIISNFIFLLILILLIIYLVKDIKWMNTSLFLDEITLLTILLTLPQNLIIELINNSIRKK